MPKKRTALRNVEHRNSRFVPIERWLTLDGLEHEIARHYFLTKKGKISYHPRNNPNQIHIVRYAEDCAPRRRRNAVLAA